MNNNANLIKLGNLNEENIDTPPGKRRSDKHVPSHVRPDTLFTFTTKMKYIVETLENKMVAPRYVEEDVLYLKDSRIKKLAIPMKCFCDIPLNKIEYHTEWYGSFGLAFKKEWGIKNNLQPVQYLNGKSPLAEALSKAFKVSIKGLSEETPQEIALKDFLANQILFSKPYTGFQKDVKGKRRKKCFGDECEWRYVPDMTEANYKQCYLIDHLNNNVSFRDISNSLSKNRLVSLPFDWNDLKYIILPKVQDLDEFQTIINNFNYTSEEKQLLLGKVLIWETIRDDM